VRFLLTTSPKCPHVSPIEFLKITKFFRSEDYYKPLIFSAKTSDPIQNPKNAGSKFGFNRNLKLFSSIPIRFQLNGNIASVLFDSALNADLIASEAALCLISVEFVGTRWLRCLNFVVLISISCVKISLIRYFV
jgi:hypothetical protein